MDRWGFRVAGLVNVVGVLVFSLAFTNERLSALDPVAFSRFGLVAIILWGLAYLAAAEAPGRPGGWLALVFAVEKLVYVASWVAWMRGHAGELPALFSGAPLTAIFYAIYGPLDLLFAAFFASVARRRLRPSR